MLLSDDVDVGGHIHIAPLQPRITDAPHGKL
jgi:hypothetical protein